jgi:hypothetical protein
VRRRNDIATVTRTSIDEHLVHALIEANRQLIHANDALLAALMARTGTEYATIRRTDTGATPRQAARDLTKEAVENEVRRMVNDLGYQNVNIPDVPEGL